MRPVLLGVRAVGAAFSFLTVLPFGRLTAFDGKDVARGSVLFGLVGGAIGALTGGAAWFLGDHLPPLSAAVVAVALGAAVTGALHLDGLADCADGFGGRTPADRLRIMRDHTIGTYGGTALLLDLLLRVAALSALAGTRDALLFSIAAGALGRIGGPVLAVRHPYAQTVPGAGEALSAHPDGPRAIGSVAVAALIAVAALYGAGPATAHWRWSALLLAGGITYAVLWLLGWTARRRLGGVTGDVMGAASELIEIGLLTGLLALR